MRIVTIYQGHPTVRTELYENYFLIALYCLYNYINPMKHIQFKWDENKNINNKKQDEIIRIISARKATKKESKYYNSR